MNLVVVLGLAVALAMDCFAVALGASCGSGRLSIRRTIRLALHFGIFQFIMVVLGWLAGEKLLRAIQGIDHWAAFGLLAFVGVKMIRESFQGENNPSSRTADGTAGFPLILLSLATSIDSLAAGLSLAVFEINVIQPAILIGLVSFALTVVGAKLGPVVGGIIGRRAELAGGLILIGIGIKILVEHL